MTHRMLCPFEVKFAGPDVAVGTFEGYGAVFGNRDAYGDVIAPGAFAKSLRTWKGQKRLPPMLLQHAGGMFSQTAGDLVPIGVWDAMSEDDHGLYVKGRLIALDTDRGKSVYAAMQERALDGMSIGYIAQLVEFGKKPDDPARTLKTIDLVEVSVVTFPANGQARVDAIKSIDLFSERNFERLLRDAGFSREQSKTIVSDGYRALLRDAEANESECDFKAGVEALIAKLAPRSEHGTE